MQDPDRSAYYMEMASIKPSRLLEGDTQSLIDEWRMAPVLWGAIVPPSTSAGEARAVQPDRAHGAQGRCDDVHKSGQSHGSSCARRQLCALPPHDISAIRRLHVSHWAQAPRGCWTTWRPWAFSSSRCACAIFARTPGASAVTSSTSGREVVWRQMSLYSFKTADEHRLRSKMPIGEGCGHLKELEGRLEKESVRAPAFKLVLTGGEFAYKRTDRIFVIPLGYLRN